MMIVNLILMAGLAASQPSAKVEHGRMLERNYASGVQLVAEGKPACVVVYPSTEGGWRALAEQVADAVRSTGGADVPILPDNEVVPRPFETGAVREGLTLRRVGPIRPDLQDKSLIILADLNNNRAVFSLYANYYTYCDARYPGAGGYELRTIVRPFGHNANYLMIGGSTEADVKAGVTRLAERLKDLHAGPNLTLPCLLEVHLGKGAAEIFEPAILAMTHNPVTPPGGDKTSYKYLMETFTYNAHLYFYTGKEAFARRAREAALPLAEVDPRGILVADYNMENLAAAWRRVSPSPVFSSQDRLKIDNSLLGTVADNSASWWRLKDASKGIGCRHHTTGMLAWWTLIRVMQELGIPDNDARRNLTQWRREAEAYLDGLTRHYADDQDDYQSADSVQNTASYCLQTGRLSWFADGLARDAVRKVLATTDNLGWYTGNQGYGETLPGWERFTLNGGLLISSCAFLYEDGSYSKLLEQFPLLSRSWGSLQPQGLHQFALSRKLPPRKPDEFTGLEIIRLTPYRLDLMNAGDFLHSPLMDGFAVTGIAAPNVSADLAFDKAVIRPGLDAASPFLVLQGFSGTSLSTIDMNSIIRYTDLGRLWLVHNTGRRSLYFKNGVYVTNEFDTDSPPAACELLTTAKYGKVSMLASRLPDYHGTTWTRYLINVPEQFTIVIDRVRAAGPGNYLAVCSWRTPGFAKLDGNRWEASQDDVTLSLLSGATGDSQSERGPERDGATRPTVLRQRQMLKSAPAGEEMVFENLLAVSPSRQQRWETRRIAPGVLGIREIGEGADGKDRFWLVAAAEGGIELRGVKSDARMLLLSPDNAWIADGNGVTLNGARVPMVDGQGTLVAGAMLDVWHALSDLWDGASPRGAPGPPSTKTSPTVEPRFLWTHRGPSERGGLVDGVRLIPREHVSGPTLTATDWILPVLRAEPRLWPGYAGGFKLLSSPAPADGRVNPPDDSSVYAETTLSPLKDARFILELPEQMAVSGVELIGDAWDEFGSGVPAGQIKLEVTFTNDAPQADRRTRQVAAPRTTTWHNLYKGHTYPFESYRVDGLDQEARQVEVRVLNGPDQTMPLVEAYVRSVHPKAIQVTHTGVVDIDKDGDDEIVAWNREGDLVLLSADGRERWRKSWPQGLVTVDACDLEDDGLREVFVSRADRQVDVFNVDGSPRWSKDFSQMWRETDEKRYTDGSAIYGMAAWRPAEAKEKQVLFTGYFFATRLDARGKVLNHFKRAGHFTAIRPVPAKYGAGIQFAARSDIPWVGPVPLEWWGDKPEEPIAKCSVPNGSLVTFEVDDFDADGKIEALFASQEGIGLYSPTEPTTRWQYITDAPCVGAAALNTNDGGAASIVYGREDGYIFVLHADGKRRVSTLLDEPLTCLTGLRASDGRMVVLVGTRTSLRCLQADNLAEIWRHPASYRRLELLSTKAGNRVLAITPNGSLTALGL